MGGCVSYDNVMSSRRDQDGLLVLYRSRGCVTVQLVASSHWSLVTGINHYALVTRHFSLVISHWLLLLPVVAFVPSPVITPISHKSQRTGH